jgi:hypothetical protein
MLVTGAIPQDVIRHPAPWHDRQAHKLKGGARTALSRNAAVLVDGARAELEHVVPLVRQVIAQTRARIFGGDTHHPAKLLSLWTGWGVVSNNLWVLISRTAARRDQRLRASPRRRRLRAECEK